jgi:hypothetical protein
MKLDTFHWMNGLRLFHFLILLGVSAASHLLPSFFFRGDRIRSGKLFAPGETFIGLCDQEKEKNWIWKVVFFECF